MAGNEIEITYTSRKVSFKEAIDILEINKNQLLGGNISFKSLKGNPVIIGLCN